MSDQVTRIEDEAMQSAIARALRAHEDSGRTGIAAAVIFNGKVIITAENHVNQNGAPPRHAEIVALNEAAEILSVDELASCTLISTLQPCEMCLSAIRFCGIERIVFAARKASVAGKYFVFPKLELEDFHAAGGAFSHVGGVREQEVVHLYADGEE